MGSRVRNVRILEVLARDYELSIVTLVHDKRHLEEPGDVARLGRWTPVLAPHRRGVLQKASAHLESRWKGWREGLHPETFFQSFPEFSNRVREELESFQPDLVHCAYWYSLMHLTERPRPPVWVVDTHDVQFERQARLWNRESPKEKARELEELSRFDHVIAITDHDREVFRRELPDASLEVVGMGVDLDHWSAASVEPRSVSAESTAKPPTIIFYGNMTNDSNQTGARHLLNELVPRVAPRVPDLQVMILGAGTPDDLRAEAAEAAVPVEVTGFVEDVRPYLASGTVLALSLRTGSGQRGRVVECAALGLPAVGYPEALQGLEFRDGEGVLSAEDPEFFAERLIELLTDDETRARVADAGRRAVEERYGLAATYGRFSQLYERWLS